MKKCITVPDALKLPLREPEQSCETCRALGTIGRAVHGDGQGNVLEIHRYCRECWPEHYRRYRAQGAEWERRLRQGNADYPDGPCPYDHTLVLEAASWEGVLELLEVVTAQEARAPLTPDARALIARSWSDFEAVVGEPMPPRVRAFVEAHRDQAR